MTGRDGHNALGGKAGHETMQSVGPVYMKPTTGSSSSILSTRAYQAATGTEQTKERNTKSCLTSLRGKGVGSLWNGLKTHTDSKIYITTSQGVIIIVVIITNTKAGGPHSEGEINL